MIFDGIGEAFERAFEQKHQARGPACRVRE